MERAPETAALAAQAGRQIGDDGQPQSRSQPRGVFEVDEDAPLAELERAWADGGYHGFCVLEHSAIRVSAAIVLAGWRDLGAWVHAAEDRRDHSAPRTVGASAKPGSVRSSAVAGCPRNAGR